jgi:hypothetical protein
MDRFLGQPEAKVSFLLSISFKNLSNWLYQEKIWFGKLTEKRSSY